MLIFLAYCKQIRFIYFAIFTVTCISISSSASNVTTDSTFQNDTLKNEKSWQFGFELLTSGRIIDGLKWIDSLCVADPENTIQFDTFTRNALRTLIFHEQKKSDEVSLLNRSSIFDTLTPNFYSCKVTTNHSTKGFVPPTFLYSLSFAVERPFELAFCGLQNDKISLYGSKKSAFRDVMSDVQSQLFNRDDSIRCSICIDLSETKIPLQSYIAQNINGVFDSILVKNDLSRFKATALRCYRQKRFNVDNGKFVAIVAFDKFLPDHRKTRHSGFDGVVPIAVRYTVIVQAPVILEDLAEAKFQAIVNNF